jgi:CHASE1-domain containing sensor protein/two-component sensor histidine kinase
MLLGRLPGLAGFNMLPGTRLGRFQPYAIFVVALCLGIAMTVAVFRAETAANQSRFERLADETVDRINNRIGQHIALLTATRGLFEAQEGFLNRPTFQRFVQGLDLSNEYAGVQGIGFARHVSAGPANEIEISAEILRNYDITRQVVPPVTSEPYRTPIVLLEPLDDRNREAIGYDMYSEATRRSAMILAMVSGEPTASAPVRLVQETADDLQMGFLVYLPFMSTKPDGSTSLDGFVYAPFRAGDLHNAIIDRIPGVPYVMRTTDSDAGSDGKGVVLYQSPGFEAFAGTSNMKASRALEVAGRHWHMQFIETGTLSGAFAHLGSLLVGAVSILLAGALMALNRIQLKHLESAQTIAEFSRKSAEQKDLLLGEMKHRIKNHIARIQAMARQTLRNSDDLETFDKTFSARLQSMANAQDLLTRSHWDKAELKKLIAGELEQVFGFVPPEEKLGGPVVQLGPGQTQAMGLTIHELATNAMKYGQITDDEGDLSVKWAVKGRGKKRVLHLRWREKAATPIDVTSQGKGFGSRLIEANIKGELKGEIERKLTPEGLTVIIRFPLEESYGI